MEGKLFTGSHDATMRVWDITGIDDDTVISRNDGKKPKREKPKHNPEKPPLGDMEAVPVEQEKTKILIDEDENMNMNGHGQMNGNIPEFNNVEDYSQKNNCAY